MFFVYVIVAIIFIAFLKELLDDALCVLFWILLLGLAFAVYLWIKKWIKWILLAILAIAAIIAVICLIIYLCDAIAKKCARHKA